MFLDLVQDLFRVQITLEKDEKLHKAREVARKIRAGWVTINHAFDMNAAFGGYKHSGNGREWSEFGFHEYLEVKSTLGYAPETASQ